MRREPDKYAHPLAAQAAFPKKLPLNQMAAQIGAADGIDHETAKPMPRRDAVQPPADLSGSSLLGLPASYRSTGSHRDNSPLD